MRKRKYIINLFAAAALLVGCGESLEDTYSDYAGDGKIRYVAKCTEVHATPGWERLLVEWINGTDATVDKIKVIWSCEDLKDSVLLPSTAESYELTNLTNGTYRFDVSAIDFSGNESLVETTYGRPYTREHEIMLAFTRGVVKPYFLKNKLIFFSDQWNENIDEIKLQYKNTQGDIQYYTFDKETSYSAFITIDDVSVNPTDTIYVLRKGRVEGCPDLIEFDPLALSHTKIFSSGFVNAIERRYGYSNKTKEQEVEFEKFVEEVTELEFDYDIETFEDVLYCPNLKKLVFAKNRYLDKEHGYSTDDDYPKLRSDIGRSLLVLDKASEPDVLGLKIEWYGGWNIPYFEYEEPPYMEHMGFSPLPAMEIIQPEALKTYDNGSKINCSPSDLYADLDALLDDDYQTTWTTTSNTVPRKYEMAMELLEETEISGIKIAQPLYHPMMDRRMQYIMPSQISIQVSTDGGHWQNVTYFETNELGRGSGEVTLLKFPEGSRRVRYIKFTLQDGTDPGGNCAIALGDILLFKLK